jgi:hypothetical protein
VHFIFAAIFYRRFCVADDELPDKALNGNWELYFNALRACRDAFKKGGEDVEKILKLGPLSPQQTTILLKVLWEKDQVLNTGQELDYYQDGRLEASGLFYQENVQHGWLLEKVPVGDRFGDEEV